MTVKMSTSTSDNNLNFIQKQHAETLQSLHAEIQHLRSKNSELSLKVLSLDNVVEKLKSVESERDEAQAREIALVDELETAKAAESTARSEANRAVEHIQALTEDLENRDEMIASLTNAIEHAEGVSQWSEEVAGRHGVQDDEKDMDERSMVVVQYADSTPPIQRTRRISEGDAPKQPSPPKGAKRGGRFYRRVSYTQASTPAGDTDLIQNQASSQAAARRFGVGGVLSGPRIGLSQQQKVQPGPPYSGSVRGRSTISEPVGELPAYPEPIPPIGTRKDQA